MALAISAALCAALFLILHKAKLVDRASRAPGVMILGGAVAAIAYRATGGPFMPSEWAAAGADALLAALAFAAATQFRISRLAAVCPAAFRLTIGGAPLFFGVCALAAFILAPELNIAAALLVAAALTLNGAAFDRRSVALAPAPGAIKAAVRLESAAILALGVPFAFMLEAFATAAPQGMPSVTPLYEAARGLLIGFALGGSLGLISAYAGNRLKKNGKARFSKTMLAGLAGFAAFVVSPAVGAHAVIAAAAAGLLWGEQTTARTMARVRMRRILERCAAPAAYLAFGALLAPRLFQAELLSVIFALSAVTIMRAGPRLVALRKTALPRESQAFLAWYGGAPGAASALFLISLFDAPTVVVQDAVLTVGALAVALGVLAARLTSRPLLKVLLKETALARKRAMFAEA